MVHLLGKNKVDARIYLPSSSRCLFRLIGIDENKLDDPNLQTQYLIMIDELASPESAITISQMRSYIEKIFLTLKNW